MFWKLRLSILEAESAKQIDTEVYLFASNKCLYRLLPSVLRRRLVQSVLTMFSAISANNV